MSHRLFFESLSEVKNKYPLYTLSPSKNKIKTIEGNREGRLYKKIGTTTRDHSDNQWWKMQRSILAIGTTAMGILLMPLLFKSYRKLVLSIWSEATTGIEKVSLYLFYKQMKRPQFQTSLFFSQTIRNSSNSSILTLNLRRRRVLRPINTAKSNR